MSIEVVTTGYGRPALRALRDAIAAAKGGEPLAPVTVIVPSNHVGVAARRLLAAGIAGDVIPTAGDTAPEAQGPGWHRPGAPTDVGSGHRTPPNDADSMGKDAGSGRPGAPTDVGSGSGQAGVPGEAGPGSAGPGRPGVANDADHLRHDAGSGQPGVPGEAGSGSGSAGSGRRGVAGVSFLTAYRLAELLGAPRLAAAGRRPVSTPVVAAGLRRALAEDPGVFGPVAAHPATETALVAAYAELSDVSPPGLESLARAGQRAADVVRLCRRAREVLAAGWYDEGDLVTAAVDAAVEGRPPVGELGHVVIHLVQDLNQRQARLLRAVSATRPTTAVAALTGLGAADAGVLRSLDRLGCKHDRRAARPRPAEPTLRDATEPSLGPSEALDAEGTTDEDETAAAAPLTRGGADAGAALDPGPSGGAQGGLDAGGGGDTVLPVRAGRTRVLTASDADEEVRAAVRAIVAAARRGTPLERIALLFGAPEPYGRLAHEHLAAAGIPRNGTAVRPLAASAVGRLLLDLLALPDHRFRRADVLGLLTRSTLRGANGHPAPVGEWERLSREAGVVAARDDWERLLGRLADGIDRQATEIEAQAALFAPPQEPEQPELPFGPDSGGTSGPSRAMPAPRTEDPTDGEAGEVAPEPRSAYADVLRRRAASARWLQEVVVGLIDDLTKAQAASQPWQARVEWARRLVRRLAGGDRRHWPADEAKAAEAVDAALDRLATLDTVDAPPTLEVFRRTLTLELDADLGRVGRFGEGVLVAPLALAVGLDLDLVIVLGLAEGTLPGPVRDDSLMPDAERQRTAGELPLRRERVGRDHRRLWAALAGADRHLLCAPRGDLRVSNERVVSRWALAAASALHGAAVTADELGALRADWLDNVPSFAYAVSHTDFPPTEQDYRLRAGPRRAPDAVAAAGAEVIAARRSHAFTRFDGNLSGAGVPSPTEGTVSSTRLETWAACPHAYFVRHLLRVEPIEAPERQLTITAIDRGSLVHEVLDRFVSAVLARPPEDQPDPTAPWTADDHALMADLADQVCREYEDRGMTGRPVFWRRDRAQITALVDRFLREDDHRRRDTRTHPLAAELLFGREGGELDPVEMPLTDGRSLQFSGAVDRIDVADDGTLHVIDYKTGGARPYASLGADDPDQRGTRLQLAVYGQAARAFGGRPGAPVRADYWFVSDREGFSRKGYEVDDDVLARVSATLTTIVGGIESGAFPARPDDSSVPWVTCEYCDPDGLGTTDLRRAWERKRDDPLVAPYAELAEPRPDDPPAAHEQQEAAR